MCHDRIERDFNRHIDVDLGRPYSFINSSIPPSKLSMVYLDELNTKMSLLKIKKDFSSLFGIGSQVVPVLLI